MRVRFAGRYGATRRQGRAQRDGAVRLDSAEADCSDAGASARSTWSRDIYPLCRSITGDGVRETLESHRTDACHSRSSRCRRGTPVFDWEIPLEWNVRDAYIADAPAGGWSTSVATRCTWSSYSVPVRARMTLEELRPHLHTLPEQPDWIPYRTSYYREAWGFCLAAARTRRRWPTASTRSSSTRTLKPGSLTYAECFVPGASDQEVLVYTHTCHPALANDNASRHGGRGGTGRGSTQKSRPNLTYRFVFGPGTIGSIAWLARNEARLPRVRGGLTIGLLGDARATDVQAQPARRERRSI